MTNVNGTVVLRNGAEVPEIAVVTTWLSLERLAARDPVAFFEAAALARDPGHRLFGNAGKALADYGLAELDGTLHNVTREVILAAVAGDGTGMRLVSPYDGREVPGDG